MVCLCGSYFTNCYTSSKKEILLTDVPSNEIARIDCNWNNEPILLFTGNEENAGLKYKNKPNEKSNIEDVSVICPDYESLTNLKTIKGRAVKIKNPTNSFGIGGAWAEGIGDIEVSSFSLTMANGKDLIQYGIDVDPDFYYERFTFGNPTKNVVLDKESTLAIRKINEKTHRERVELLKEQNLQPENTIIEKERRKKEIE